MKCIFYKIRVLPNAFFLAMRRNDESIANVYCLTDLDLTQTDLPESIRLHDLHEGKTINELAEVFGVSNSALVNRKQERASTPAEWRPVCDTDFEYNSDLHPYLAGFRSTNFDLCMLAALFSCQLRNAGISASGLNALARQLDYGRCNIDRFSEQDYGLAKAIRQNMIRSGRHIDVARLNEKQSLCGLHKIAGYLGLEIQSEKLSRIFNMNDLRTVVSCLCHDLDLIQAVFESDFYFSAFATKQALLFAYPETVFEIENGLTVIHPDRVKKNRCTIDSTYAQLSGSVIGSGGRLYDLPCISFAYPGTDFANYTGIPVRNVLNECRDFFYKLYPQPEVRADFDRIYEFFSKFDGKTLDEVDLKNSREVLMLYQSDGSPSPAYAMFSCGGVHGTKIRIPDGHNQSLNIYERIFARTDKNGLKLRPECQFTVSQPAVHCDFNSFYPHLCINTGAFLSPHTRTDRMIDLLQRKSDLENQIRQESDEQTIDRLRLQRQAAKLLINSATGAADTSYDSLIRMNHRILSLRLIGQLITWKMAQMFAYCGAEVININTDGIYVSADESLVRKILIRIEKEFRIPITAENVYLIAKDVNNTLTLDKDGEIVSASGTTLVNCDHLHLDRSPDRPVVVDWVLARMLRKNRENLFADFDMAEAMSLLKQLLDRDDWPVWFQWILNQPKGSVYFTDPDHVPLDKHARVFLVTDSGQAMKRAALKSVTEKQRQKRAESGQAERQHDLIAVQILQQAGVDLNDEFESEAVITKIPKWEDHWKIKDVSAIDPDVMNVIRSEVDLEAYAEMIKTVYENQWKNR